MSAHHGNGPRAWRLIMAKLHGDTHAEHLIRTELGDCQTCWADTADRAAEIATTLLVSKTGCTDAATRITESEIALDLEAADRDAKGLPVTPEWIEKCVRTHLDWL